MTGTMGILIAIVCFIACEIIGRMIASFLYSKGVSYEIQYVPLFIMVYAALSYVQNAVLFPPALNVLIQLGIWYSVVGAASLLLLAFIRFIHYQSYILILNWLKKE